MPFSSAAAPIARALAARNYVDATPVQAAVLQADAKGRDLLVSAQTGSGKTVAFGLAIAETLMQNGDEQLPRAGAPAALIVAPTRELALQVERELTWLYQYAGARIASCVGGMDARREERMLDGGAHIVVGTPGRLCDHLRRGSLDLSKLQVAVLDEADEMLDMGFREDLEVLLDAAPKSRRSLMFSATMPRDIQRMAERYQNDALRIEVMGESRGHADIEYRAIRVLPNQIEHATVNVLRQVDAKTAIVFCGTREATRHLAATLTERGFDAVHLSGELSQAERNRALQGLRDGRARICVATDVAARGIDLPSLGLVIHADLPKDAEVMQHRSGRTGRAGRKGISVLLVPPSRLRKAEFMMKAAGVQASWQAAPTAEEIRKLDQQRLVNEPFLTEEITEEDRALAAALLAERSAEEIAAALVRVYRTRLPAPEDVVDPSDRGARPRRDRDDAGAAMGGGMGGDRPAMAWFALNAGRADNADPRWLIPLLCRRGKIAKQDIGAIRIFDEETRFEVVAAEADAFETSFGRGPQNDARLVRLDDAAVADMPARSPRPAPRRFENRGRPERARPEQGARPERRERSAGGERRERPTERTDRAPRRAERRR